MKTLFFILLILSASTWSKESDEEVDYYVNLISKVNASAFTYVWPKNADEYEAYGKRNYFGSYDFVIIGGGPGGIAAASVISENKNWTVLILEAGKHGDNVSDIPGTYGPIEFTHFNWAFNTTPQETACQGMVDNVCVYPRGKGLGGSSLINVLGYFRGYKSDYDKWAQIAGNERWGYESVTNYFKSFEHYVHRDPEAPYDPAFHGTHGPLRVEYHLPRSPQLDTFLKANKELGFNIADYNANQLGVSPIQLTMINGTRLDDDKAFLRPIRNRQNLRTLIESYVTKIRIDKKRLVAEGVEFSHKGKNYYVKAKKEVILAAGAFGSPQILMLSGVGPKEHLEKLNIDLVADLEVGSTLLDHPSFLGLIASTNFTAPTQSLRDEVKDFLKGLGPLTIALGAQGIGMYESSYTKGTGTPDIELIFSPAVATDPIMQRLFSVTDETYEDLWKYADPRRSVLFLAVNEHVESKGTFRLKSKNPYDYPLIDPNYLSDRDNKDITILYEAIQLVQKLLQTQAFRAMDTKLQGVLKSCKQHEYLSKDYWFCALRQMTAGFYHPSGTCKMGTDPKEGAVVDSELRVFGFKNLRVSDTSVIPLTLASHTHAPTVMVGKQLGDLVKETYKDKL